MRIYIKDLVELKYCIRGTKEFCKRYNLDFRKLVREGLDVEELEGINDAMVENVIQYVKNKEGR